MFPGWQPRAPARGAGSGPRSIPRSPGASPGLPCGGCGCCREGSVTPLPPAWTHAALRDPTQDPATEPRGSVR